jgi:actin-related protein
MSTRTCCFDHPDPGLRAALELQTLLRFGRIRNIEGMMMLMSHLLEKALPRDTRWTEVQILFNYNIACDRNDLSKLTRQIFQIMSPSKICFLDEAGLIARGTGFASAMIVDIGTTSTKVQPVFEDLTMRAASRVSKVGGEHCTNYLETLLHAQRNEKFSSQLERRRRQFARKLKEEHAFVCDSFEQSVADFGEFSFEAVNVMSAMNNQNRPRIACAKLNRNTQITSKIQLKEVITLSDNTPLVFTVDIERFYCAEVLFTPDLYEECKGELSIANLILQSAELISDEDVRKEVCACIAVTGKTAYIPGLKDRLRAELKDGMARLGVSIFDVVIAEDAKQPPSYPSASWRGADVVVKRATDMYNVARIEPQHFVTYEDWEVQGQNLEPYLF